MSEENECPSTMPLVFVDLDDTLFQSKRRISVATEELAVATYDASGQSSGFMLPPQLSLWNWLNRSCRVVPTTCRSLDQFRRTMIVSYESAILFCGAYVTDHNGHRDEEWTQRIVQQLIDLPWSPGEVERFLKRRFPQSNLLIRLVGDAEHSFYVYVKDRSGGSHIIPSIIRQVRDEFVHPEMSLNVQKNSLFLTPSFINKREAARYLLDTKLNRDGVVIGIGDAISDCGFMDLCDFAMTPTNSQIWEKVTSD